MKFVLFVGGKCPNCKPMKANLDKCNVKYDIADTDTVAGAKMSVTCHVRSLPTLVVTLQGKPISSFCGVLPVARIEEIDREYHHLRRVN